MKRRYGIAEILLIGLMVVMLGGCSGGTKLTAADAQVIETLGHQFIDELNQDYLPERESSDKLLKTGAVLETEKKTYNIEALRDFYDSYRVGSSADLVCVFDTKSFVVVKLHFDGANIYYFRYEYDRFNEEQIEVSSEVYDSLDFEEDANLDKAEITLRCKQKKPVVFTFNHLDQQESP